MTQSFPRADLEAIRARTRLSALIGKQVKLRRAGRGWKGLCPFHGEKTASFNVDDERGTYHCYGCGAHGRAFDWVMHVEGVDFAAAVTLLAEGGELQGVVAAQAPVPAERRASGVVDSVVVGRWNWRTAVTARGSIVERYLASRGLDPAGVPGGLDALRFHPRAAVVPWRVDAEEGDAAIRAPAMLGLIVDAGGAPIGVHATYLHPRGEGKAALPRTRDGEERPSRKMWGRLSGGAVWLSGSPAGARDVPLVAGEGIETGWAFVQQLGRPCRLAAALSLDNLQGFPVTDGGVLPWWNLRPDPARAAFTIPDPGDVVVLVDADMKPLRDRKVQRARGRRWTLETLSGADRAQLCATLAVKGWQRAGARRVEAVRPPAGMDFNDAALASGWRAA